MSEKNQSLADGQSPLELKQIVGGLLFAAHKPLNVAELRAALTGGDQNEPGGPNPFGKVQERDIRAAIEQLQAELTERKLGIILAEVAGRFRFQTDPTGGPWVRQLLNLDKPTRLSKPALETLAII
ncbi:MAG: SMC-Scp complex subunit ScpB, partial [Lentisphaerae bacterium]|nr:SMC-Scp complex subunit ScpB [Lentisphaerota bacterium]